MAKKTRYILQAAAVIILAATLSCGEKPGGPSHSADGETIPSVQWYSFSEGLLTAKKQAKPLLIFFYTDWCIYCKKMDREIFSDRDVINYMNGNYICVRTNPETEKGTMMVMGRETGAAELMGITGASGYPSIMFWNKQQKPVTSLPGYREKNEFIPILRFIAEECYLKQVPLDDYIKAGMKCNKIK